MDDIILIHLSKDTLKQTTLDVIRFLQNLSWRLSPNKRVLILKMTFQYLGWQFQTEEERCRINQKHGSK
ncbi:MAG: hypothetical protein EZS28_056628 [Streblomastix strix]|uniref:Reverse transcriptase domain-containing protein n=1 Tax=Streblomastix strix TaxID=222440 RepID=A0A5J4PGU8_9EUKA|nr:MAG: hypothetical protein EZS28_056628 [Streblomastix strix]